MRRIARAGQPGLALLKGTSPEARSAVWQLPPASIAAAVRNLSELNRSAILERLTSDELHRLVDALGSTEDSRALFRDKIYLLGEDCGLRKLECWARVLGWGELIQRLNSRQAQGLFGKVLARKSDAQALFRQLTQCEILALLESVQASHRGVAVGVLPKKRLAPMLDELVARLVALADVGTLMEVAARIGDEDRLSRALGRIASGPEGFVEPGVVNAMSSGELPLPPEARARTDAERFVAAVRSGDKRTARRVLRQRTRHLPVLAKHIEELIESLDDAKGFLHAIEGLDERARRRLMNGCATRRIIKKLVREHGSPKLSRATVDILAAAPGGLALAAAVSPRRHARSALEEASARSLVRAIQNSEKLRRYLDEHGSRAALRRLIPAARAQGRNGYDAAAFEVSFAFSLQDLDFLRTIAARAAEAAARGRLSERRGYLLDGMYRTYKLPKRSGGNRTITVPQEALKRLQRRLLVQGFHEIALPAPAHGFRRGRSIVTNAAPHVRQTVVLNVDIARFFETTGYGQIVGACRKLWGGKLSRAAVLLVADVCTFNSALPTGAPTSPAVGNLVLASVDQAFRKVCARRGLVYTRYADDLTISGPGGVTRLLPFIEKVLSQKGYQLDPNKLNIFRRGRRQVVTGLVVNERPNIKRAERRRLRAAVHHRCLGRTPTWHGRAMSDAQLRGRLAMLEMCDPKAAEPLIAQLSQVVADTET